MRFPANGLSREISEENTAIKLINIPIATTFTNIILRVLEQYPDIEICKIYIAYFSVEQDRVGLVFGQAVVHVQRKLRESVHFRGRVRKEATGKV